MSTKIKYAKEGLISHLLSGMVSPERSMRHGKPAGANPWGATGLEWQTPSPPPTENFETTPVVTKPPYHYGGKGESTIG